MLHLTQGDYPEAEQNLSQFLQMEEGSPDNCYLEGFVHLARTYIGAGATDKAERYIKEGSQLAAEGPYENPLYQLQFLQLKAELDMARENYASIEECLTQSLKLAESLDNPIQTGFIWKLWGRVRIEQNSLEEAEEYLTRARDIFLSLGNKYQAGQVVTFLETLPRKEPRRKQETGPAALSQTIIEDDEHAVTRTETEKVFLTTETEIEDDGLEKTEVD